jgi:thiamine pyrophosphokinase
LAAPECSTGGAFDPLVSVFPLGQGPWDAESEGLRWPLAGLPWDRGFFGISNVAEARFALRAKKGRFLVILPLAGFE